MKKYLSGTVATIVAVCFCFLSTKKIKAKSSDCGMYYVYIAEVQGPQNDPFSYLPQYFPPLECPGSSVLCWFKVDCSQTFTQAFWALDRNCDNQINAQDIMWEDGVSVELQGTY